MSEVMVPGTELGTSLGVVQDVAVGDIDGNGTPDVVMAAGEETTDPVPPGSVGWFTNDGSGGFFGPILITTGLNTPNSVLLTDIDGDLDLDLVVTGFADNTVGWLANSGLGAFGVLNAIDTSSSKPVQTFAADLDGDGDLDLLVAPLWSIETLWYPNTDGAGTFGPPRVITALTKNPACVASADLDGDGDMDALIGAWANNTVGWFANIDGLGSFGAQHVLTRDADDPTAVAVADFDGDGDPDIVSVSRSDDTLAWFRNMDGAGNFSSMLIIATVDSPRTATVVDVDADGVLDIVVATWGDGSVSWFRGLGGAFDIARVVSDAMGGIFAATAADLTGDGRVDLVSTSAASGGSVFMLEQGPAVRSFDASVEVSSTVDRPSFAVAVDIDGDGDLDVAVATFGGNRIEWFANLDGLGSFGPPTIVTTQAKTAISVLAFDPDADGDPDLASASSGDDKIAWYENIDGRGAFGPQIVITTVPGAWSVAAADMDADGDLDLVATGSGYQGSLGDLLWCENLGTAALWTVHHVEGDLAVARRVSVSDLNNDGSPDVVVAYRQNITWYANNGTGGLAAPVSVDSNAEGVSQTALADLDGDGWQDIAAAVPNSNSIMWYRNTMSGSFAAGITVSSDATFVYHVAAGDIDGDGDLDLASASHSDNKVAWYPNIDGAGTFGAQQVLTTSLPTATLVQLADLDGDGDVDVLAAGLDGQVVWFKQRSRNAFTPYVPTEVVPSGGSCTTAPFSFSCVTETLSKTSVCAADTVVLPPGSYDCRRDAPLMVTHPVVVAGRAPGLVTFDCKSKAALFDVTPHVLLAPVGVTGRLGLVNVTLKDVVSGLSVHGADTALSLDAVAIDGCSSPQHGGCITVSDQAQLAMTDSTIEHGKANGLGGAVFAHAPSSVHIAGSTFSQCEASVGAAVAFVGIAPGSAVVEDSMLTLSTAGMGAGVAVLESLPVAELAVAARSIADVPSASSEMGPPAASAAAAALTLDSVRATANRATLGGGVVFACGSSVRMQGAATEWSGNSVTQSLGPMGSSADALLCTSPTRAAGYVPDRASAVGLPWLSFEAAVFGGPLALARIHTPITRLEWLDPPAASIQSGQTLTGTLQSFDGMGQQVVYDATLVRVGVTSAGLAPTVQTSVTTVFESAELAVSSIPAVVLSADVAPVDVSFEVGLVKLDGTASRLLDGVFRVGACSQGYGTIAQGSLLCSECIDGTVSLSEGFDPCLPCPFNSEATRRTNVSCSCKPGFYEVAAPDSSLLIQCLACPPGGVCTGAKAAPVAAPGFYARKPGSLEFVACEREGCVGADGCQTGYTGYMCSECTDGYYSSSERECSRCPTGASGRFAGAMVVLGGASCAVALFVAWSAARVADVVSGKHGVTTRQSQIIAFRTRTAPVSLSMVFVAMQVVSILAKANWGWSDESKALLGAFSVLNIDAQAVAAECSLSSFHVVYVTGIIVPLFLLGCVVGIAIVLKELHGLFPFLSGLATVPRSTLRDSVIFTVAPLLYIPVSRSTLILFDCSRLPNGVYTLDSDQGEECFDAAWWGVLPLGLLATFGFVLGVPAWFASTIFVRKHKLFEPSVTMRFGTLYRNFRREFYWGEIGNLGKRLAIVVIATFLSKHQLAQLGLLTLVFVLSLIIVVARRPYFVPLYNDIDIRLSFVLLGILMLGIASYAERDRTSANTFFLVGAVTALAVLIGVSAHAVLIDVISLRKERTSQFHIVSQRQQNLVKYISAELTDVEPDAALLHAAGEFLATLDNTVRSQNVSRVRTTQSPNTLVGDAELACSSVELEPLQQ